MGDIDTAVMDSLKVLDPKRPIREADISTIRHPDAFVASLMPELSCQTLLAAFAVRETDRAAGIAGLVVGGNGSLIQMNLIVGYFAAV